MATPKMYAYGTPTKPMPGPQAKPPPGWKRSAAKLSAEVVAAAARAAKICAPVGKSTTYVDGQGNMWMFLTEYHWDNHVSPEFKWHPGITVYEPKVPPALPRQVKVPPTPPKKYDPYNPTGGTTDIVALMERSGGLVT